MGRTIDLTSELSERAQGKKTLGPNWRCVSAAARLYRRPVAPPRGLCWLFPDTPFLQISRPIALPTTNPSECGRRLASFLSPEMKLTDEARPRSISISADFGLISEIERLQYQAYFAHDTEALASLLACEIVPFVHERLGAIYVCVVRPNFRAHQARISIAKALWAVRKYPREEVAKRIPDDRVLTPGVAARS